MERIKRTLLLNFLDGLRLKWLALPDAARWLILIGATLMLSKAVVLEQGPPGQFWAVTSTFGTLIAAFAAYYTAAVTKATLDNQLQQVEEEKVPWLIVSEAAMIIELREAANARPGTGGPNVYLTFTAANMSRSAMQIYQVMFFSEAQVTHGVPQPAATQANDFIPPNEKVSVSVRAKHSFYPDQVGEVYVFFYYGATGHRPHALKWTYEARRELSGDLFMRSSDFRFHSVAEYMPPNAAVEIQKAIRRKHGMGVVALRN